MGAHLVRRRRHHRDASLTPCARVLPSLGEVGTVITWRAANFNWPPSSRLPLHLHGSCVRAAASHSSQGVRAQEALPEQLPAILVTAAVSIPVRASFNRLYAHVATPR